MTKMHIFYNSNYTNLVENLGKQIKWLCNMLCNINSINNYHTFRTFGNKINILFENHLIWNEFQGSIYLEVL